MMKKFISCVLRGDIFRVRGGKESGRLKGKREKKLTWCFRGGGGGSAF